MSQRQRYSVSNRLMTKEISTLDTKLNLLKNSEPKSSWLVNTLHSEVLSVEITADEKFILAGLSDGMLYIFEIGSDTENSTSAHSAELNCLAVTSDSAIIVTGSYDSKISLWSIPDLRKISELEGHSSKVYDLAIFSDNTLAVSAGDDKKIHIWNLLDYSKSQTIDDINVKVYSINISKDDNFLALGCTDNTVRLWNLKENREQLLITGHEMPVYSVLISKDMEFLISASIDKTIRKWDFRTGKLQKVLIESIENIKCICLTSDDKYAIYGQYNGSIGIVPVIGKYEEIRINEHLEQVNSVKVSRSAKYIVSCSSDKTVRTNKLSEWPEEYLLNGHKREINNIEVSHDNQFIASASHDHSVRIWSFDKTDPVAVLEGHRAEVYCVTFTKDNRCISGGVDENIIVWDLENFTEVHRLKGHDESIRSIAVSPDDKKLVSGSMDKTVRIWSLVDYSELFVCRGHDLMVNCVAAQNKIMVSGSDDETIQLWNNKTGVNEKIFTEHQAPISCLCVTDNRKKLVAGGRDGRISVWNLSYRSFEGFLVDTESKINKLCLSGDSQYIFTQHDNKLVKIWSLPDKQILGTIYEYKKILSLAVSRDNEWVLLSTQKELRVQKSPLSSKKFFSIVPYKYSFLFRSLVYRLLNGSQKNLLEDCLHSIFLPWNINLLHILSFMNYPKVLKTSIGLSVKFLGSDAGETPLKVSLNRRSKLCAEILLKRIPKVLYLKNSSIFEYIGDILENLNTSSLPSLHILYDAAFPLISNQNLPKFGKLLKKPPIILLSDEPVIRPENFLKKANENEDLADREIEFRQSLLKLDLDLGSKESIKFMKSLKQCKNNEVFRSELVKVILNYKWRQIMPFLLVQALLYIAILAAVIVQTILRDYPGSIIVILFLNSLFFLYEIGQLKTRLTSYFYSPLNVLGLIRILFIFSYCINELNQSGSEYIRNVLLSITNALIWIRLIGNLRIFDRCRYLLTVLKEVFKALGPFIILYIFILAMMIIAYHSDRTSLYTIRELVINIYSISYGQFNTPYDTNIQNFVCVISALFITLMMMNLMIALLGDIYQRVKDEYQVANRKEMTSTVLEVESILWFRKSSKKSNRRYIQQCTSAESKTNINVIERETEQIIDTLESIDQRVKVNQKRIGELLSTFVKFESHENISENDRLQDMLMGIKHDIKDAKKEMRLEMMKTKLDIADIRKDVLKVKNNK